MTSADKLNSDDHKRRPVIIGVGQSVHHPGDLKEIKSPLDIIQTAIEEAEEDSGVKSLKEKIDTLCLVNILSRPSDGLPSELSNAIGAKPADEAYTWVGASAPQWFVNRTAEKIVAGRTRLALICGGEAFFSKRLEAKEKGAAGWDWNFPKKEPWMIGDMRDPLTALEMKYCLLVPLNIYPLFENALRYHKGVSIEQQRRELGEFCASMSTIAAKNPYAWFKKGRTSSEIISLSAGNRMVSFPYTKFMCSIMEVDQAAALFLTDVQTAKDLGVPQDKWIYLLGSGDAYDHWHVSERVNFYSSPSVKAAAGGALDLAGVTLEEIDYFDFYSCFPCAPRITRNMLKISDDDARPLTITGGMPYFGGPGNNYSLHAICNMVALLRQDPEKIGMIQALSWFISKHSVGIYSGATRRKFLSPPSSEKYRKTLKQLKRPCVVEEATGRAVVETYSIFHDSAGEPINAVIIGRLDDGTRFLAKCVNNPSVLHAMMKQEFIGTRGRVRTIDDFNIFEP
jgi:acetyl-CoA C-acetyltransferase